jgi:RNA polymerase sigma factor (sigma-70 family)
MSSLSLRIGLGTLVVGGNPLTTQRTLPAIEQWGGPTVGARRAGVSTSIGSAAELDLVGRIAAGDGSALRHLYADYGSLVYSIAARVTQDRCAAQDVAQQVFIRVWERPTVFDPDRGSLCTWLATLAHSRAVDHVRREEAGRRREQQQLPGASPDVEEAAMSSAVAERVRRIIDTLPDDQRTAILLAYYDARTYRQVAANLDIPEGTAKSRLRLGLRRIAKCLEQEGLGVST